MKKFRKFLALALFCPVLLSAEGINYAVEFQGIDDPRVLKAIKSVSQLTTLKKRSPPSLNALRYRAEADIPDILKILHAHGYYEATVDVHVIETYEQQATVTIVIHPGPLYTIGEYDIELYCHTPEECVTCTRVSLEAIGIEVGRPALAQQILDAELKALRLLSECGYPLASIAKRSFIADGETKSLRIRLEIDTGERALFGKTEIQGMTRTKPRFIDQKMSWKEGDLYNSALIDSTQKSLLDTGLFSSILITHAEQIDPKGELPLRIDVTETKHHSVNVGASYQTVFGPGATFGWEDRNIGGMGRKLHFQADVTRISHSGIFSYQVPDCLRLGQDYIVQAQAMHETIKAYHVRSYNLMNRFERKVGQRIRVSLGAIAEQLLVTASVDNGNFFLLEAPIYFRWSSANSLLNPTSGMTVQYKASPSLNVTSHSKFYLYQEFVHSCYLPLVSSRNLVLAQKITLGSLVSSSLDAIPVPKRFLGGSEEELRGYLYRTVSPLAHHHKPIGGRSAIYYSLETRIRATKAIGLVPFFDTGNVQRQEYPTFKGKWHSSVGIGVRYFTFVGPFRLDVGFPLNPRKHLDPKYKIFVSIGQMF